MSDEMTLGSKKLRILLISGIILGVILNFLVNSEPILLLIGIVTQGEIPHNVYVMNYEQASCDFYMPEQYLPAAAPQIENNEGYECSELYQSFSIKKNIEIINSSDHADSEVKQVLEKASMSVERNNLEAARSNLSRIGLNQTYYIK